MAEKKILDADYLPESEYGLKLKNVGDQEKPNWRVIANLPAGNIFYTITDTKPPMALLVCRADRYLSALGAVSALAMLIHTLQAKLNSAVDLTQGVGEMTKVLNQEKING